MINLPNKKGCALWGTNKCMYRPTASGKGHGTCLFCVSLRLFGVYNVAEGLLSIESMKSRECIPQIWYSMQSSLVGGSAKKVGRK